MLFLRLLSVFGLLEFASGFKRATNVRTLVLRHQTSLQSTVAQQTVNEVDISALFCAFSDKYLLLDVPGAGTPEMVNCCHSGCDNCEFARIFDCLTSGRPKWVALYAYRQHSDGRDHTPPWTSIFENKQSGISKTDFIKAVSNMPRRMAMGIAIPFSGVELHPVAPDVLEYFWNKVVIIAANQQIENVEGSRITADQLATAMKELTKAEHGADYNAFKRIFQ